jgi:hypothetical protein
MMRRFLASGCAVLPSFAAAEDAPEPAFKLTVGWYRYSDSTSGVDTNLRHTSELGNAWLGYFRYPDPEVKQWRTGWDRSFGSSVRVMPSLQWASGGFVGGSIQAEAGAPWFAGAGLGRTNLRPYYNLNFDPNDSWLLTAGHRGADGRLVMAQMVRDNREHPDQRHFHAIYRQPLPQGERLTVDALYKVGLVEDVKIRRFGLTVTYDWPKFFMRVARDPKTNFTPVDAWRLSVGTRF